MTAKEQIIELRRQGISLRQVADITGYTYSTVATYCHRYNIRSGAKVSDKKTFPAVLMAEWDDTRKKLLGIEPDVLDIKRIYHSREELRNFKREWDKARRSILWRISSERATRARNIMTS